MSEQPKPAFVEDNPVMGAAFAAFMQWLWGQDGAHRQFQEETGTPPLPPIRSPMDAMIDEATGLTNSYMTAFVAWGIRTQWGEEGDPALLDEEDPAQ